MNDHCLEDRYWDDCCAGTEPQSIEGPDSEAGSQWPDLSGRDSVRNPKSVIDRVDPVFVVGDLDSEDRVQRLHEPALLSGGGVGMDRALLCGAIESAACVLDGTLCFF